MKISLIPNLCHLIFIMLFLLLVCSQSLLHGKTEYKSM